MPVVENRGEGVFLRFDEDAVGAWEANAFDNPLFVAMRREHRDWRLARGLDPNQGWPGERYVLDVYKRQTYETLIQQRTSS